jgi:acyl-CoA reductase-like NAD-dependent aldehyde dehydrogenase
MTGDRSISDVLQDILRNVQEILRSEVRLAKAEIREEATQAASSALWVTVGVVVLLSAWMFLLWTAAYALAAIMPMWSATVVIAIAIAGAGSALIAIGIRRFTQVKPMPERTIESLKENLEWMKQPTK